MSNPEVKVDPPQQPNPRVYRGNPAKQRDPSAKNAWKPRPHAPPRVPLHVQAPSELPPPTKKHDTSKVQVSSANPADSAIFATGISVREVTGRTTFTPSAPSVIEVSRQTFSEIITDDPSLGKVLLAEYIDYYATALLWLRIVHLKERNSQELTVFERDLLTLTQTSMFCVPEPLLLEIRAIGNVVTTTKQHLYPAFPPLPSEVINNHGGYYGILHDPANRAYDPHLHNLYEEIPCLGVLAEAVRNAVSNNPAGPYPSVVTFQGQQPNANLLGKKPLAHRRSEAKNLSKKKTFIQENL